MSTDDHGDDAVVIRDGRTRVRPPTGFEGTVPDRSNPTPLNRLSPGSIVTVQVLALGPALVAGVLLAPHGVPVWVVPVIVAVAALALTIRWRDHSPVERLVRRGGRTVADPVPLAVDLPDGSTMGVIRDGRLLVSVLAVRPDSPVLVVDGTRPAATIPLDLLSDHLSRYDVDLHSIDVTVAPVGVGEGDRTAWITLRFDPALDPAAVDRRGGGDDGAVRTLVTVTRRLALRLGGEGLAVTPLDSAGIDRDIARYTGRGRYAAGPTGAGTPNGGETPDAATAAIDPASGVAASGVAGSGVAGVLRIDALARSHAGATWISLRGRDRAGRLHWCAAVTVPPGTDAPAGTRLLDPRAGGDPLTTAPGRPGIGADSSLRPQRDTAPALAAVSPVLDGTHPLLGVDADGRAVRLGLPGHARRMSLVGTARTARLITARALSAGIAVEVITEDPTPWGALHSRGHRLVVRHPDAGHLNGSHPDDRGGPGWTPGLVVVDATSTDPTASTGGTSGELPSTHPGGAPVLTVTPPGGRAPRAAVQLTENVGDAAGSLTVTADGRRMHLGLLELRDEAQYV